MQKCSNCGLNNLDRKEYCWHCGYNLLQQEIDEVHLEHETNKIVEHDHNTFKRTIFSLLLIIITIYFIVFIEITLTEFSLVAFDILFISYTIRNRENHLKRNF